MKYTKYSTMQSLLSRLVHWLLVVAIAAIEITSVLVIAGTIFTHYNYNTVGSDMMWAAVVILAVCVFCAIEVLVIWAIPAITFVASWICRIAKFAVVIVYVVVFGLLTIVFGNKVLKTGHKHAQRHISQQVSHGGI